MAEDERAEAGMASPAPIPPERKRRWVKRLALSVAVLLLVALLLIAFLPTILTSGPLRRFALARVNEALPAGDVTLDGLAFGWLTTFRLDGLRIRDADGAPLLALQNVRINRSLWEMLTKADRLGTVEIRGLDVRIVRRADGSFAFTDLMGPAAPEAPHPTEDEATPFELRLSKLLPPIQIPTAALDIRLIDWKLLYTDDASRKHSEVAMGELALRWAGGRTPLLMAASGDWELETIRSGWFADLAVEDWIRDGMVSWESIRIKGKIGLGESPSEAVGIDLDAAFAHESVSGSLGMDLSLAEIIRPLAPDLPKLGGKLMVAMTLDTLQPTAQCTASISISDLAVSADPDWSFANPSMRIDATAELDSTTLDPGELTLKLDTPWIRGHIAELPTGSDRSMSATLRWRYGDWIEGVGGELAALLPQSDLAGTIELLGVRSQSQIGPYQITALTQGTQIVLPTEIAALAPQLRDGSIGLSGWIPTLTAGFNQHGDVLEANISLDTDLYQTRCMISQKVDGERLIRLDLSSSLEPWLKFVRRETTLEIPAEFSGRLELSQDAAINGATFDLSGTLLLDELRAESELLPGGAHSDRIKLEHTARIDTSTTGTLDLTAALRSMYVDTDLRMLSSGARIDDAAVTYRLRVGDLMQGPLAELLPADLGLGMAGDLVGKLELAGEASTALNVTARLETADNFVLTMENPPLSFSTLGTELSGSLELAPSGISISDLGWQAIVDETLTVALSGSIQQNGDRVTGLMTIATEVYIAELLAKLEGIIQQYSNTQIFAEGSHRTDTEIQFSIQTGESPALLEPIRLHLLSTLEAPSVQALLPDDSIVEFTDLMDSRVVTLSLEDLTNPIPFWTENGEFSVGMLEWSGGVNATEFQLRTAGGGAPTTNHRYGIESVSLASARYESDAFVGVFPPLDAHLSLEGDSQLTAVKLSTQWSLGEAVRFGFDGVAGSVLRSDELWDDSARVESSLLIDLGRIVQIDEGNSLGDQTGGLGGRVQVSLDANATNVGPRFGWSLPTMTDWRARFRLHAEDVTLATNSAELSGGNALVELDATNHDWRVELDLMPAVVALGGTPAPHLEEARTRLLGTLDAGGELNIIDAFVDLPRAETLLALRGVVRGLGELAASPDGFSPNRALDLPGQLFLEFRQGLTGLGLYSPLLEGSGELMANATLDNLPGQQVTFGARLQANQVSLGYADFLKLEGLDGALPYSKRLFHRRGLTDFRRPVSSSLNLASAIYDLPPYGAAIRSMQTTVTAGNTAFAGRILSGDFLGGQIDARVALRRADRDPAIEASFSVTGFDGASVLPNLRRVRRDRRSFDAFGFAQMRFREGSTISGLMDDVVLRMDLTNFSREFLRELIRFVDPEGASPGIQAMNAALAYASPSGGHLEIRSGLINADVRMVTAAKVEFPMPLFDRTSLASALEPYVQPAWNELLPFARQVMAMLLAEDIADLKAYLEPGVTP